MDETKGGLAVRIRVLLQLAGRYESFAANSTSANVRDRYLKIAELYRERAQAEEREAFNKRTALIDSSTPAYTGKPERIVR